MELFDQILKEMPIEFTTNLFVKKMRERNISESIIRNQRHIPFLTSKCERYSRNTFAKKYQRNNLFENQNIVEKIEYNKSATLTENQCIEFLKSKGYKILQPITEYKEL
jgi:hypothetical protein